MDICDSSLSENEKPFCPEVENIPSVIINNGVFNLIPIDEVTDEVYDTSDVENIESSKEDVSDDALNASISDTVILSPSKSLISENELQISPKLIREDLISSPNVTSRVFALAYTVAEGLLKNTANYSLEEAAAVTPANTTSENKSVISDLLNSIIDQICQEPNSNETIIIQFKKSQNQLHDLFDEVSSS